MRDRALSLPAALVAACVLASILAPAAPAAAQQPASPDSAAVKAAPASPEVVRATLLASARKLMNAQKYCAFITVDAQGRPQVRTINPFPPEKDMTVWFATNVLSRKVRELKANPHVALYYADHGAGNGYVQLSGTAVLVSDKAQIERHRRPYWAQSFPGDRKLILVKIVPDRLDVLDYANGMQPDSVTWRVPTVDMNR